MKKFNLLSHIRGTNREYSVVWLFNIGVEKYWNNTSGFVVDKKADVLVNHAEEMMLLLARPMDYVIMRRMPEQSYLTELKNNGYNIPSILCPSVEDETKGISELVLDDKELMNHLAGLAQTERIVFVPYGVSFLEEKIAEICHMRLIGGPSEKSKAINDKIISRDIASKLNFPVTEGIVCHTKDELDIAYEKLHRQYNRVIIKMPCNASGKGMWIIDDDKKYKTVSMIVARFIKTGNVTTWLIEGWVEKQMDLNFQIYVSEDGDVEVFSIKEQLLDNTVYIGSLFPPRISDEQYLNCNRYGMKIGKFLREHSYTGIFGVDALITKQGEIIPIIEINGRFTLSTYVSFFRERFSEKVFYSFYKKVHMKEEFRYSLLVSLMKERGLWFDSLKGGLFVYTAASVDTNLSNNMCRIFCITCADSTEKIIEYCNDFDMLCSEYEVIENT